MNATNRAMMVEATIRFSRMVSSARCNFLLRKAFYIIKSAKIRALSHPARERATRSHQNGREPMQHSAERILTTHAGSLPRPGDLLAMMRSRGRGETVDEAAYKARVRSAVADIVRKQVELGIDIVSDGEMSKQSFLTYVSERLGGFELDDDAPPGSPFARSREFQAFPEFYEWLGRVMPSPAVGV